MNNTAPTNTASRTLQRVVASNGAHWVGDGFPVRSMFDYNGLGREVLSPFLMLDYAGPYTFAPAEAPRGVGEHPHRGFETVTLAYQGEVEHRDSSGGGGIIHSGDVQWMTAASGVMHDEFHSANFTRTGGIFEMIQLWVNLPAKDKMTAPRYQTLTKENIPVVALPGDAGHVRVVAGEYAGTKGTALTFSPVELWDLRLHAGKSATFSLPAGHTVAVLVRKGALATPGNDAVAKDAEMLLFSREGETFTVVANADTDAVVLGGKPLGEPVVGYGPFVMTSQAEIRQAFLDVQSGKFGKLA